MTRLLLAGDIGGTWSRLELIETQGEAWNSLYKERYSNREFQNLVPIVQQFLTEAAQTLGDCSRPQNVCFAVAGPVINNTSQLTHLNWFLNAEHLKQELAISQIQLINDFEAACCGILHLDDSDLRTLQSGERKKEAPIAVIGAGTGLGKAFLLRQVEDNPVYATEGGHTDFAAHSILEFELLKYLQNKHKLPQVSAERVVSSSGVLGIYQFLRDSQQIGESQAVGEEIRNWEQKAGSSEPPAEAISKAAKEKSDELCVKTMRVFVEAYGAEAGNLALRILPYGGLYVAGGIAPNIIPLLEKQLLTDEELQDQKYANGLFLSAFTRKGRMKERVLEKIPVYVVQNLDVALIGAAHYVAKM